MNACRHNQWTIGFWRREQPDTLHLAPYRCKSWRHTDSPCAEAWGRQTFCRIRDALKKFEETWLYLVLGFRLNPNGSPSYIPSSPEDAYLHLCRLFEKFKKRVQRKYRFRLRYICLVERHRSGYPHLNVLISCPALTEACKGDGWTQTVSHELREMAVASGFGEHLDPQRNGPIQTVEAVAGYFVKLMTQKNPAERAGGMAAEFSKSYQIPDNAPIHFRRLRASRGVLPPPKESTGEWDGGLVTGDAGIVAQQLLDLPAADQVAIPTVAIERPAVDVRAEQLHAARDFARARAERRKAAVEAAAAPRERRESG